jgi:hypothetical protein
MKIREESRCVPLGAWTSFSGVIFANHLINRVTGYDLLSRLKHRLAGRHGREDFQDVMEFPSYGDIREVRRYL